MRDDEQSTLLILEGRLIGEWVEQVHYECEKRLLLERNVILDLGGVSFVDDSGIEMLKRIKGDRVQLTGLSLFLEALLEKNE